MCSKGPSDQLEPGFLKWRDGRKCTRSYAAPSMFVSHFGSCTLCQSVQDLRSRQGIMRSRHGPSRNVKDMLLKYSLSSFEASLCIIQTVTLLLTSPLFFPPPCSFVSLVPPLLDHTIPGIFCVWLTSFKLSSFLYVLTLSKLGCFYGRIIFHQNISHFSSVEEHMKLCS